MYEVLNQMRRNGIEDREKLLVWFDIMTKKPMEVQTKLLMELLNENKDTEYGRKYNFEKTLFAARSLSGTTRRQEL